MREMKEMKINNPTSIKNKKFTLKGARLNGYEYEKKYYIMQNGKPTEIENGDDSALTIIAIKKQNQDLNTKRKAIIASEGYIGADRAYNEDGTKKKSISRKSGFGISYLIDYINKGKEIPNDFYVAFMSDKENSEKQAELFAHFIKEVGKDENISSVNMWSHSKSALLSLRAFQKMREENNPTTEKTLNKINAVLTSMPAKGIQDTDRKGMIDKLNQNKILSVLPFSGYIKTGMLAFYDKFLYKACPAQVDIKAPRKEETALIKEPVPMNTFRKILNKIQGNDMFEKKVQNEKPVEYDAGYLPRVMDTKNMNSIKDVKYKTIPVDLEKETVLSSLLREGQVMPLILYLKKQVMNYGEKGDGINTYESQGIEEKEYMEKLKVDVNTKVRASHDVGTTEKNGMEVIARELDDEER